MLLLNILPLQSVAWAWIPSVVGVVQVIHLQKSGASGLWSKDGASAIDAILWPSRTKISQELVEVASPQSRWAEVGAVADLLRSCEIIWQSGPRLIN